MRNLLFIILFITSLLPLKATPLTAKQVVVIYNSALPESKKLAETYRAARGVPAENLIGLPLSAQQDITREEYNKTLRDPLRKIFQDNGWLSLRKDSHGVTAPSRNDMRVLLTIRGVPIRVTPAPLSTNSKVSPADPINSHNEACVDSELCHFAVDGVAIEGALKNPMYESKKSISEMNIPFFIATCRIDAASQATCERMIRDAVETEAIGLWGRAYVDVANKFPEGDAWLNGVVKANVFAGIPTVVDRFDDTFPKNYPMTNAALYYGWYDWNLSGPFLNPKFRFKKGAVAMHLHSFSAMQLANPTQNWSSGLLEKGAAVTIGNVYEPYLAMTHHFDILNARLLAGNTFVDAAWMSILVSSWQGIILGDPLYRPYAHFDSMAGLKEEDKDFAALHAAASKWPDNAEEYVKQLADAAKRTGSGNIMEAIGLWYTNNNKTSQAESWFEEAKHAYTKPEDKLRQDIHLIGIDRAAKKKLAALDKISAAQKEFSPLPEVEALNGWKDILDPPAPPPVKK